jgi:hypothetical protein
MRFRKTNRPVFGERPHFHASEPKNEAMKARSSLQTGSFIVFWTQKQAVLQVLPNIR